MLKSMVTKNVGPEWSNPWARLIFWGVTLRFLAWLVLPLTWHNDIMNYSLQAARMTGLVEPAKLLSFFPPGYPAFLALCRFVAGDYCLAFAALVQQLLCVASVLMIGRRLGLIDHTPSRRFLYFAMCEPVSLIAAQQISPEVVIGSLVVTLWFLVTGSRSGVSAPARWLGIGGLMGYGIAAKTILVVFLVPLVILLFVREAFPRALRCAVALMIPVIAIPSMFIAINANLNGQRALSDRSFLHVYNRVVAADRSIALEGPESRRFLSYFGNDPERVYRTHPSILPVLKKAGYAFPECTALMRAVVFETLLERPWVFIGNSLYYPFRDWHRTPHIPARATATSELYPDILSPRRPQFSVLIDSVQWRHFVFAKTLAAHQLLTRSHIASAWAMIALLAIPLAFARGHWQVLMLFVTAFALVSVHSLAETFIGRYLLLAYPAVWFMVWYTSRAVVAHFLGASEPSWGEEGEGASAARVDATTSSAGFEPMPAGSASLR
jgi:hypothetical protein